MKKSIIATSILSALLISNFAIADNLGFSKVGVTLGNKDQNVTVETKEKNIENKHEKEEYLAKIKLLEKFNYQPINIHFYTMTVNNDKSSLISEINTEINSSKNIDESLSKFGNITNTSVLTMPLSSIFDSRNSLSTYGLTYRKTYISSVVLGEKGNQVKTYSEEWGGITAVAKIVNVNEKSPLVNFAIKEKVLGEFPKTEDGNELPNVQENDLISTVNLDQKFKAISISNFGDAKQKTYKLIIVENNFNN